MMRIRLEDLLNVLRRGNWIKWYNYKLELYKR
jgi:hypothetical protein